MNQALSSDDFSLVLLLEESSSQDGIDHALGEFRSLGAVAFVDDGCICVQCPDKEVFDRVSGALSQVRRQ